MNLFYTSKPYNPSHVFTDCITGHKQSSSKRLNQHCFHPSPLPTTFHLHVRILGSGLVNFNFVSVTVMLLTNPLRYKMATAQIQQIELPLQSLIFFLAVKLNIFFTRVIYRGMTDFDGMIPNSPSAKLRDLYSEFM